MVSVVLLLVEASAGTPARTPGVLDRELVGAWEADIGSARWAIVRRSDHTFSEIRLEIRDYSVKKTTRVTASGTWSIRGKSYVKRYHQGSDASGKTVTQRDRSATIVRVASDVFDYHESDGPLVRERRLGGEDMNLQKIAPRNLRRPFADYVPQ